MTIFCKAMHKEASLVTTTEAGALVCSACYMMRSAPQMESNPLRDRDVAFDEKHDVSNRLMFTAGMQLTEALKQATQEGRSFSTIHMESLGPRAEHVPSDKIWADTQNELSGKMVRCAPREVGKGLDWNSVMRGFRCIQPNKTRLPFWAPYNSWADLVCPHCSSSVSQGLTSGHHEMDGASPITLAMLRKEVPADDLRFAEPRPGRYTPNSIGQAGEMALKEATGHVERLLGHFTTQDFTSGNPDKRRALVNAINWLNDNK